MPKHSIRKLLVAAVAAFLVLGFLIVDSSAQKKRRRRRSSAPRITNPDIYQPATNENANSNASGDENSATSNNANTNQQSSEDPESMKRTIRTLSNQVDKLNDKLNSMEQSQQSLVDLERLSRAEQRSAQLRSASTVIRTCSCSSNGNGCKGRSTPFSKQASTRMSMAVSPTVFFRATG